MGHELLKRSLVANHGRKIAQSAAFTHEKTPRPVWEAAFCSMTREEELLVLGRPGSDLLSQGLSHSTIGAEEFNGRVRDGIGFMLLARTTRPAKHKETKQAASAMRSGEWGVANSEWNISIRHSIFAIRYSRVSLTLKMRASNPIERVLPVSCMHYCTSTPGLSTWSSSTVLKGMLVLRWVSRLDAFSGYPVRT